LARAELIQSRHRSDPAKLYDYSVIRRIYADLRKGWSQSCNRVALRGKRLGAVVRPIVAIHRRSFYGKKNTRVHDAQEPPEHIWMERDESAVIGTARMGQRMVPANSPFDLLRSTPLSGNERG